MLRIYIHGIDNGLHEVNLSAPVNEIEGIYPEFFGEVFFNGKMRKVGKRFSITGTVESKAKLICDISLDEFVEDINFEFNISILADTNLYRLSEANNSLNEGKETLIHEDDKYIDLSNEIMEELTVHLPMKRIAPKYRDKDFEDIYPDLAPEKKENKKNKSKQIDNRWSKLANLKLN